MQMRQYLLEYIHYCRLPEPIPSEQSLRMGVIYGTCALVRASDDHSFTAELHKLMEDQKFSIQFGHIARMINERRGTQFCKQFARNSLTEYGNNWDDFYWPQKRIF